MSTNLSYVLLVDDEPSNLFLLEELLQLEGYKTLSATSGNEAIAIAKQNRPDLVLLDVMMPEMDGFEVCERFRTDPTLQTVPVIFLTALDDDESRLKGLHLMGDDYLTKPIQSTLMLAKITNVLQLNQLRSQQYQTQARQMQEQSKRQMAAAWQVSEALSEKFRLFVPEQFLQRIAPKGVESIQVGNAVEAEMSILFCDIREFTAIAESQQAVQTFAWLNAFFTEMNRAIVTHFGFIDKYLGDAMMAVFDRPQHAQDALNAAITMRQTLRAFNATRSQFNLEEPVNIGIGIHTGIGLIGTIGADNRMDSTVIGDVVNTASRLEELTKTYGCQVIASDAAIAHLEKPPSFHVRWIDRRILRGKQQSSELYEVIGTLNNPIDPAKIETQPLFEQGIKAWQQQNFAEALSSFQQVLEINPTDTVAVLYSDRCQTQLNVAPSVHEV